MYEDETKQKQDISMRHRELENKLSHFNELVEELENDKENLHRQVNTQSSQVRIYHIFICSDWILLQLSTSLINRFCFTFRSLLMLKRTYNKVKWH